MRSDLRNTPIFLCYLANEKKLQFLSILLFGCVYLLLLGYCIFFFLCLLYVLTWHGVNTISGAYTVFGLCFIIILHFDSSRNTFGMDLGTLV